MGKINTICTAAWIEPWNHIKGQSHLHQNLETCLCLNHKNNNLYAAHIFNTLFGLYIILNKLQQLQTYDKRFQQPGTQKVLTKTLLQTLDSIYVHQPKRFLLLAKEAKKLAEEF